MLGSRLSLITVDPPHLGECVRFVEDEVRPTTEIQSGSLGTWLCVNSDLGVAIFQSFWASVEDMQASQYRAAPPGAETLRPAAGTLTVENYQHPVFELDGPVRTGAQLRLTRMGMDPAKVPDAVEAYGDTAVPWLADTDGFRSASLLVSEGTGQAVSQNIWDDSRALADSRGASARVRAAISESAGWQIKSLEEYEVVYSTARTA